MHVMDMFRSIMPVARPATPTQDPMNPNNPNVVAAQQANMNAVNAPIDGNPQPNSTQQTPPQPPVEDYSKLWDIDPNRKVPQDLGEFKFNVDPAKVSATFGQLDFTKHITPEILAKINAGGPEAMSAMLGAMNTIAQQAAQTAVLAGTRLTETGLQTTGQRFKDQLPDLVRSHTVSAELREGNPLMKDPAFAPIVSAITEQFTNRFPQASTSEIQEHTRKYFEKFAAGAASYAGKTIADAPIVSPSQARQQTDWSAEPL